MKVFYIQQSYQWETVFMGLCSTLQSAKDYVKELAAENSGFPNKRKKARLYFHEKHKGSEVSAYACFKAKHIFNDHGCDCAISYSIFEVEVRQ